MSKTPEEASADSRAAAPACRDMYVALQAEGFTVGESLTIIGHVISAGQGGE